MTIFDATVSGSEGGWRRVERRGVPRHPLRVVVTLRLANGAVTEGRLRDMSTQGAFVRPRRMPFGLDVGEEGMLCLALPGGGAMEHRFSCEIRRTSADGVAVRFLTGE
ncbi:MAG: PilZ domain-containing protein [Magnetococcales bacterium]|nr:PilZ domain-containing protein [Magnetococcales bacterium]